MPISLFSEQHYSHYDILSHHVFPSGSTNDSTLYKTSNCLIIDNYSKKHYPFRNEKNICSSTFEENMRETNSTISGYCFCSMSWLSFIGRSCVKREGEFLRHHLINIAPMFLFSDSGEIVVMMLEERHCRICRRCRHCRNGCP